MLLLSIHPRHVDAILAGDKRVELRRRRPRVAHGQALIYATAPRMELVARFQVVSVTQAPLHLLWQHVRDTAGVTRSEFESYFHGLRIGTAIHIGDVTSFKEPVRLSTLRRIWAGFQPPQGFRYVAESEIANLAVDGVRSAA